MRVERLKIRCIPALPPEPYLIHRTGNRIVVVSELHPENRVSLRRKKCGCLAEIPGASVMTDSWIQSILRVLESRERRRAAALA
jgi:hypothetical protein